MVNGNDYLYPFFNEQIRERWMAFICGWLMIRRVLLN